MIIARSQQFPEVITRTMRAHRNHEGSRSIKRILSGYWIYRGLNTNKKKKKRKKDTQDTRDRFGQLSVAVRDLVESTWFAEFTYTKLAIRRRASKTVTCRSYFEDVRVFRMQEILQDCASRLQAWLIGYGHNARRITYLRFAFAETCHALVNSILSILSFRFSLYPSQNTFCTHVFPSNFLAQSWQIQFEINFLFVHFFSLKCLCFFFANDKYH